ncbi:MAG: phosphatidate cytidylyltransferase [Verrucomicrobiota bacterium]
MMSPSVALHDPVFRVYAIFAVSLLVAGGGVLAIMGRIVKKDISSIWKTYRSWCIIVPVFFGFMFLGRGPVIAGVTLLGLFGFKEYARATGLYRDWWMTGAVYIGIIAVGLTALMPNPHSGQPGWYGLFMTLPVYVVSLLILVPIISNRTKGQVQSLALSIMGFIYIGWMFLHLGYLANSPHAYGYLFYLVFAVELNDVAAFTCGRLFGKHKLRDRVSPGKTLEGALGALAFSLALPWFCQFSFPHFGTLQLVLTGLIVGVGGQLGDLAISVIKRDLGVKDMGALIPGHGGILDRLDSLIYTAPLFLHMVDFFYNLPE